MGNTESWSIISKRCKSLFSKFLKRSIWVGRCYRTDKKEGVLFRVQISPYYLMCELGKSWLYGAENCMGDRMTDAVGRMHKLRLELRLLYMELLICDLWASVHSLAESYVCYLEEGFSSYGADRKHNSADTRHTGSVSGNALEFACDLKGEMHRVQAYIVE